ncbi:MAG: hypothetical protein J6D47_04065 [Peptostreptococcaceae bacterium]|nr:hypothetical protein [Peptostreptococcaceae bacterium]
MKGLETYIRKNIDMDKSNIYYNESFCNLVLDYLGSKGEFTQQDIKFLVNNGYSEADFIGQ